MKQRYVILLVGLSLLIGGLVSHFGFPIVVEVPVEVEVEVKNNNDYGVFNCAGLQVELDERTGNLSIYGLRPGNLWIGDVDGFSMWPTLKDGSRVIIEEVQPWDEIMVGDIVVFDDPMEVVQYIIHRVVEIGSDEEGWYAKTVGDNLEKSTEWVPLYLYLRRSEIWGKVRIYIDY